MKTKIFVTLMVMLSMVMISAASTDNFTIEDTYDGVTLDVEVECDGINWGRTHIGNHEMEGTAKYDGETYNADLDANGLIREGRGSSEEIPSFVILRIDGRLYQNGETKYLSMDDDNRYYGYEESGYLVDGHISKLGRWTRADLGLDDDDSWYSMYVITKSKPREEFTLSSPPLGLGYKGSVAGDSIPQLYTYRDTDTWKRVISETFPVDHDGPVIVTPPQIAGEPLQEIGYWDSARGQRVLEWKANSK